MKMSKYIICCQSCFDDIAKKSTTSARLWMDFCAARMENQMPLQLKGPDCPQIRILEQMGFLISTDRKNSISIKVNGYMNTEDGEHYFCLKQGNH